MFAILIVEDNRQLRENVHDLLQARFPFARLAQAGNVKQALQTLEEFSPDVIFLDVNLPDGSGLSLTRQLRPAWPEASIAIFTSYDVPEFREEALRDGADHFLVKGTVGLDDLCGVVRSALASRFRVLALTDDAAFTERLDVFLCRFWPDTELACASDRETALETAHALKPHLVVLRSWSDSQDDRAFCEAMRACCAGLATSIISIGSASGTSGKECPVDHCLADGAESSDELAKIVDSLRKARSTERKT